MSASLVGSEMCIRDRCICCLSGARARAPDLPTGALGPARACSEGEPPTHRSAVRVLACAKPGQGPAMNLGYQAAR
eukprot:10428283-Alexandrium_andersonii.AAC.1